MFHALPQTEGVAYWWWRAFGGCLAIQVGQSLALITALRVFFAPGGFTMFGPNASGLVNLLLAMALLYILFKIPFWVLASVRGGGGRRGLIGSLVRAFVAYKTFGLFTGRGGGRSTTPRPPSSGRAGGTGHRSTGGSSGAGGGPSDPYANPRTTGSGQYVLPLTGTRRTRPAGKPTATTSDPATTRSTGKPGRQSGPQSRQTRLPLGDDWPENKPVLGRDGQYRLPLNVNREPPPPTSPATTGTASRPARAGRGRQLELPFDPYKANRANRSGQYPLPLDGVRKTPAPTPAPPPAARPAPRAGKQLRLPLDLPKPARPPTPPTPTFSSPPSPPPPTPPRPARPARPSRNPRRKDS
jgi:hypothetical protein